ncbi:M23 family peptidase [Helicobacter aurati]|uniref:M23 family peptidase n=1 Tax=Helicobacter aurati TaxID=137778 RepID=A0A3D8J9G1_9HELI|nr:M23 family metallopeptidase [Helicobacter aurati]RDU73746.1 M23 family peptidase [Helicobacter aurati]
MQRVVLTIICATMIWLYYFSLNATSFERIAPNVELFVVKDRKNIYSLNTPFFNPANSIKLQAFDSSGLLSYTVHIAKNDGTVLLDKHEILTKKQESIDVMLPQLSDYNLQDGDEIIYTVSVRDWSNAHFFRGNKTTITKKLIINTQPPKIQIVATSERIVHGGSALIAFYIEELAIYNKIKQSGIYKVFLRNGKYDFAVYPYTNKHGKVIYLCLVPWTLDSNFFDGEIHVIDKAMNEQVMKIPLYANINSVRKKINITTYISDKYLNTMIAALDSTIAFPDNITSNIEKFQFLTESLRHEDNRNIINFSKITPVNFLIDKQQQIQPTEFTNFMPIHFSDSSGHFGNIRTFNYHKENIGSSTRLGIDLLDVAGNNVIASNEGKLAFAGRFSSYGNSIILHHAFGLSSVYAHLQEISQLDTIVHKYSILGKTGNSGLNFVNGVHFMLLIQGHFVDPKEWVNKKWVDTNINQVLNMADNFGKTIPN